MVREPGPTPYRDTDPRRMIARLAVAVLVADGRITNDEIDALELLDGLGLGPVSYQAADEIHRAEHQPIDLAETCRPLAHASPQAIATVLATLAELAASDGEISQNELDVLEAVARHLNFDPEQLTHIVETAPLAPGAHLDRRPEPIHPLHLDTLGAGTAPAHAAPPAARHGAENALRILGLAAGAGREQIDAAYLELVDRYNPGHVVALGPEFVVLATRKLNVITNAYEIAVSRIGT